MKDLVKRGGGTFVFMDGDAPEVVMLSFDEYMKLARDGANEQESEEVVVEPVGELYDLNVDTKQGSWNESFFADTPSVMGDGEESERDAFARDERMYGAGEGSGDVGFGREEIFMPTQEGTMETDVMSGEHGAEEQDSKNTPAPEATIPTESIRLEDLPI